MKNNYLALTGILVPFAVTFLVVFIVSMQPDGSANEKWENAGGTLLASAPIVAAIFGAILVGINAVKSENQKHSNRNKISTFS